MPLLVLTLNSGFVPFPEGADPLNQAFAPRRLTLEITEGVLMSNPEQAKRTIARLKAVGVKFALDDFGCGYASIGALREFGFDRVKIDRSLVIALADKKAQAF